MSSIALTGLSGSSPLGALATFGLFRIITSERPFGEVTLHWAFNGDWHPVLNTEADSDPDAIINFSIEWQSGRGDASFLTWHDDIKCSPERFREELGKVMQRLSSADPDEIESAREVASFFAAYGNEAVTAKSTPDVKPTAFHMTAGQQRLLKSAKELADSLDPNLGLSKKVTAEKRREDLMQAFREALLGPWTYSDEQHSLGWDPTTEALYALSNISPSAAGPRSVRAAVWLAFESLPLFPCAPAGGKLRTTGFDADGERFTWPIWDCPISLDTLRCWLGAADLAADTLKVDDLRRRGIRSIYRSKALRDPNGRGTLRNAVEIR